MQGSLGNVFIILIHILRLHLHLRVILPTARSFILSLRHSLFNGTAGIQRAFSDTRDTMGPPLWPILMEIEASRSILPRNIATPR